MDYEFVTSKVSGAVAFDVFHAELKHNLFHASTRIDTIEESDNGYLLQIPDGIDGDYRFKEIRGTVIQEGIIQDNTLT